MMTLWLRIFAGILILVGFASPVQAQQSASADNNWELCPQPLTALNDVPATEEQLQADIDRYTLCVNRAQLLLELESLQAETTQGRIDAMALPTAGGGVAVPAPLTPDQANELLNADAPPVTSTNTDGLGMNSPAAQEPTSPEIIVTDIKGTGGQLVATLRAPNGDVDTGKEGDTLIDGSTITSISTTQVMVRTKDGKTERLEWGK